MKKIFFLLLTLSVCVGAFAQKTPAQFKTDIYNNIRTQPYGTTRAGDAFDAAVNASKSFYIDGTASGTNTYAVTISNYAMTGYVTGQSLRIQFTNANSSGTITLNVTPSASTANPSPSALGAIDVKGNDGNNLAVGDIKPGGVYDLYYNGTHFRCTNVGGTGGGGPTGTVTTRNRLEPNEETASFTLSLADTSQLTILNNVADLVITLDDFSAFDHGTQWAFYRKSGTDTVYFDDGGETLEALSLGVTEGSYAYLYYNPDDNEFYLASGGGSSSGGGAGVQTVNGDGIDTSDPANPVWTFPVGTEVAYSPAGNIAATTVEGAINELDTEKEPLLTFTAADFNESGQTVSLDYANGQAATSGQKGFLTNTDWTTFNGKYGPGGTDVAVSDGGTGASTLTGLLQGNGTSAFTTVTNSTTVGQTLRVTGSNTYGWGALDLADGDAITGTLPVANGGTGGTTGAFLLGGNTLTGNQTFGDISGTGFDIALKTKNLTRYTISSTGTHAFAQEAQATTNTFANFTQSGHSSGVALGLLWTGGAHTGSTASAEHLDWDINLSATLTKAAGNYALQRSVLFRGRTISSGGAALITNLVNIEVQPPAVAGSATVTNIHSFRSTGGWVTAQQTAASTQGFRLEQSANVASWSFGGGNVMRLTSTSPMNIGPTSTGVFTLSSARSIAYMTDLNQVPIANAFTSTNTASTANKTMFDVEASWNTVPAGDNKLGHFKANFEEAGAVASNYFVLDLDGTLNFGATPTGNYYGIRVRPTISGGTLNSIIGYGVIVDSPLLKSGFGTATPLSTVETQSFGAAITSTSTNLTLTSSHHTVLVDASGGNITITLPATAASDKRVYKIKKIDSSGNTVTVDGNASEPIDGATTFVLSTQYAGKEIQATTTAWYITSSF